MGSTHAAAWNVPPGTIAGFAAETVREADPFGAQYGCKIYPNLEAMLSDIDVVDICTTPTCITMVMRRPLQQQVRISCAAACAEC